MSRTVRNARQVGSRHEATLVQLRRHIDELDTQILRLLIKRAHLALRVGQVKKLEGKRVFDPARERAVLRRMLAANRGPLSSSAIEGIYREIVRQHRRLAQSASIPS